jgi:hypothetical protein
MLVPMIFSSNRKHLLNVAGNKRECAINMKIGYLSSKICQMPSTRRVAMIPLLPIPMKNCNIPQTWLDEQQHTRREVLNKALLRGFLAYTFEQDPWSESGNYSILCADGNFRRCHPVVAGWLADSPQYCDVHHLEWHVCFWFEYPTNQLREYVPSDMQHHPRDQNLY